MAVLFLDSAAHYLLADIGKKWTSASASSIGATANPFGGPAVVLASGGALAKTFGTGQATWIAGMRFMLNSVGAATTLIELADAASGAQVDVRFTTAGQLQVTRNGTVLATSSAAVILSNTWYHLAFKSLISATVGTYAVRLNGVAPAGLPDGSGQNTKAQTAATADTIRFKGSTGATNCTACDFYICDTTGSVNNDFLGDVRVTLLLPSGAGTYTEWTPLSGANYTNVDETAFNGDTDYNYSGTVNQRDTYAMQDLASGYAVKAVQVVMAARKDDAGSRSIATLVRQGSTDVVGTTVNLLDSYSFYTQPYDQDPSDSTAWTAAKVNSLEAGAKVIS